MAQYISKAAIMAEIEKRIYRRKKEYNILEESEVWEDALKLKERINELLDLRTQILFNTLDTIEVKEVDLDKEMENWIERNQDTAGFYNNVEFAKHFFELGMVASNKLQKGE